MPTVSPYALHIRKWRKGCGNGICSRATNICHMRGEIPCELLFIAEAPGETENLMGYPLMGPAGNLLNQIIDQSIPEEVTKGFANLVGCIPYGERCIKAGEPSSEQIERCAPRLQEIINLANPRVVVCVGRLAWDNLNPRYKQSVIISKGCKVVEIVHPAAILRAPQGQQGFMTDRCVRVLRQMVDSLNAPNVKDTA